MEPEEFKLVTHLMKNYYPLVRPVKNHRDVVNVLMDMTLVEIVDMVKNTTYYFGPWKTLER